MSFVPVINDSYHFSVKSIFSVVVLLLLTVSCGSPTPNQNQVNRDVSSNADSSVLEHISAQEYLNIAENKQGRKAVPALIKASAQFIQEQNYLQALWLANELSAIVLSDADRYQLALIKSRSLFALDEIERAYQQMVTANKIASTADIKHSLDYFQLLSDIQQSRQLTLSAIDAKLRAYNLLSSPTEEMTLDIWINLAKMEEWQVQQLLTLNPPHIKGWYSLINFASKYGDNTEKLVSNLNQWQRKFPTHPAQKIVTLLQANVNESEKEIKNIAVIIPLSGKQQAAGKAIQQGILAAYQRESGKTIHFIDSSQLDMTMLDEQLTSLEIDYIIGPLLKHNVDSYLQLNLTTPTLLLNLPDENNALLDHQSAISMRHEDEAIQAATMLSSRQYKHPVVISAQDNISQRVANTFAQRWHLINGILPETIYLSADKKMQDELKKSLDVNLSEGRIKELKRSLKEKLDVEARNRRDVDMIYLVGSARETRLLKPYIDVNISPFADVIPVFASSRSHGAKIDESISRDLNGLVFTEMPWLLKSKQQNKALVQQSNKLWPQRSDSLQKIFAMGYDSISLVEKLAAMKHMPYLRHYGQTGTLRLNENNILMRSLLWGRYQRNKVEEFGLN